jgi:hypothetical protein
MHHLQFFQQVVKWYRLGKKADTSSGNVPPEQISASSLPLTTITLVPYMENKVYVERVNQFKAIDIRQSQWGNLHH